ncbi:MAG: hypothetical protein CSB33_00980 [Desulfobacterales bacterium]|nr:MAG: hypothetical protein CSB33_00980 [Desulfobacterales bacterium]
MDTVFIYDVPRDRRHPSGFFRRFGTGAQWLQAMAWLYAFPVAAVTVTDIIPPRGNRYLKEISHA